jgi:hypothetical protein
VEDGGCDDEKAKDDDLDDETGDDDVVAHAAIVRTVCGSKKSGTCVVVLAHGEPQLGPMRSLTSRLHHE